MAASYLELKWLKRMRLQRSAERHREATAVDHESTPAYIAHVVYGGDLASTGSVKPWLRAQLLSRW